MSVVWELDAQSLGVTKVWFGRTLIRSSYQLHYELAQALLNGEEVQVPELARLDPEERDTKLSELIQALEMLTHIARHLRAQRDRGGALELEGVEVQTDISAGFISLAVMRFLINYIYYVYIYLKINPQNTHQHESNLQQTDKIICDRIIVYLPIEILVLNRVVIPSDTSRWLCFTSPRRYLEDTTSRVS